MEAGQDVLAGNIRRMLVSLLLLTAKRLLMVLFATDEMRKYIERGTFVKLSKEGLDSYQEPKQYMTHHGVLKDSVTTPLRVVTNSSFNNGGNSLNSCLPKGPNSLNDMFAITLRFKCHE